MGGSGECLRSCTRRQRAKSPRVPFRWTRLIRVRCPFDWWHIIISMSRTVSINGAGMKATLSEVSYSIFGSGALRGDVGGVLELCSGMGEWMELCSYNFLVYFWNKMSDFVRIIYGYVLGMIDWYNWWLLWFSAVWNYRVVSCAGNNFREPNASRESKKSRRKWRCRLPIEYSFNWVSIEKQISLVKNVQDVRFKPSIWMTYSLNENVAARHSQYFFGDLRWKRHVSDYLTQPYGARDRILGRHVVGMAKFCFEHFPGTLYSRPNTKPDPIPWTPSLAQIMSWTRYWHFCRRCHSNDSAWARRLFRTLFTVRKYRIFGNFEVWWAGQISYSYIRWLMFCLAKLHAI